MEGRGNNSTPEGQTFRGESLLLRFINFVKLPHTLFALPFALLGLVAASFLRPVSWRTGGLVVLAFSAARLLRFGGIHINEASSARVDVMPFGGVKDSGFGREGPAYAIREMTEERLVTIAY